MLENCCAEEQGKAQETEQRNKEEIEEDYGGKCQ
jgi:hypothetical protein